MSEASKSYPKGTSAKKHASCPLNVSSLIFICSEGGFNVFYYSNLAPRVALSLSPSGLSRFDFRKKKFNGVLVRGMCGKRKEEKGNL